LGCRHSQIESLLSFLDKIDPQELYIVGDFLEGWKATRLLRWNYDFNRVINRLIDMANAGTMIFYTPGNHDAFLRTNPFLKQLIDQLDLCVLKDEFIYKMTDGRRFLVTHGDQFDSYESTNWLSYFVGEVIYQGLLWTNWFVHNMAKRNNRTPYNETGRLMRWIKRRFGFQQDFESRVVGYARENACEGIICGHIHAPVICQREEIVFCNTGDWIENCTALLEHSDGIIELYYHYPAMRASELTSTLSAPQANLQAPVSERSA
ncbi:MAG: UDP-2,3-diacylglucosamine diphosphatase, partial [Planctomycetaceae bacterium]|nr:UDP-2,3-diacylglucosamine diphosphatase [Planctomycetaceae bacterium]